MADQLTFTFSQESSEIIRKAAQKAGLTPGELVTRAVFLYLRALKKIALKKKAENTPNKPVAPKTP